MFENYNVDRFDLKTSADEISSCIACVWQSPTNIQGRVNGKISSPQNNLLLLIFFLSGSGFI